MEWQQFRELLESPTTRTLKLDNYLLFELDQECETSSILVLRSATGVQPVDTLVSLENASRQDICQCYPILPIVNRTDSSGELTPLAEFIGHLGGESALVARVDNEGQLWGFLVGYRVGSREFTPDEMDLFSFLSSCATLCVANARLRTETGLRFSEAMSLETVSSALVENRGLDAILEVIIDEAVQLLNAKDALVLLLEGDADWFQVRARIGDNVAGLAHGRLSVDNSLNGLVIKTGKPLVSHDAQTDMRADQDRALKLNVRTVGIAPLTIRNRPIGTIAVHNKRNGFFSKTDLDVLCSFANQAAIAIDNAQLFSDLLDARDEVSRKAFELQELLVRTLKIQENERKRIASDIHDCVISHIVGALYEVESCISQNQRNQDLDPKLQLLKQLLNETVEKTRSSIYYLWPSTLEHMGLIPALRELFKQLEEYTSLRHSLQIYGQQYKLKSEVQIVIYRIVQEALNNVFQHGAADFIDTSIRFGPRQIIIEIQDNGEGFNVQQVMQSPLACHFGLISMRERALSVGGNLYVRSEIGHGCQITLKIPVENNLPKEEISDHDENSPSNC